MVYLTESGKEKLCTFIRTYHKQGAKILANKSMFNSWETELCFSEGKPHVEIRAWESVRGRVELLTLEAEDFEQSRLL